MRLVENPELMVLVEAVHQVLADMGADGKICSGFAKAQLRVAFERFRAELEEDDEGCCEGFMSLEAAQSVMKECDY